jgi:hypothetical protein
MQPEAIASGIGRECRGLLENGMLPIQICHECEAKWFRPSNFCPACLGSDIEWSEASGRGRIWSKVVFHRRPRISTQPAGGEEPYELIVVRMDEDFLFVARIAKQDSGRATIGAYVRIAKDGAGLPEFNLNSDIL